MPVKRWRADRRVAKRRLNATPRLLGLLRERASRSDEMNLGRHFNAGNHDAEMDASRSDA